MTFPVRAITMTLGEAVGRMATVKSPEEARMLAGVRAMVVDDMEDARALLESALRQYGADVIAVSSAAEAYALITTLAAGSPFSILKGLKYFLANATESLAGQ